MPWLAAFFVDWLGTRSGRGLTCPSSPPLAGAGRAATSTCPTSSAWSGVSVILFVMFVFGRVEAVSPTLVRKASEGRASSTSAIAKIEAYFFIAKSSLS